jgi:hypothetical protein
MALCTAPLQNRTCLNRAKVDHLCTTHYNLQESKRLYVEAVQFSLDHPDHAGTPAWSRPLATFSSSMTLHTTPLFPPSCGRTVEEQLLFEHQYLQHDLPPECYEMDAQLRWTTFPFEIEGIELVWWDQDDDAARDQIVVYLKLGHTATQVFQDIHKKLRRAPYHFIRLDVADFRFVHEEQYSS